MHRSCCFIQPASACDAAAPCPPGTPSTDPTPALPALLSVRDLEAVFNRSARTLRRWIRDGRLCPVRVGQAVFFRDGDVRRLIAGDLEAAVAASHARRPEQG